MVHQRSAQGPRTTETQFPLWLDSVQKKSSNMHRRSPEMLDRSFSVGCPLLTLTHLLRRYLGIVPRLIENVVPVVSNALAPKHGWEP